MERPTIIKSLLSTKQDVKLEELTDEKDISYVKFFNELNQKTLDEKVNLLQKSTDDNEKILILTSIIDFNVDDDVDSDLAEILKSEKILLTEVMTLTE